MYITCVITKFNNLDAPIDNQLAKVKTDHLICASDNQSINSQTVPSAKNQEMAEKINAVHNNVKDLIADFVDAPIDDDLDFV